MRTVVTPSCCDPIYLEWSRRGCCKWSPTRCCGNVQSSSRAASLVMQSLNKSEHWGGEDGMMTGEKAVNSVTQVAPLLCTRTFIAASDRTSPLLCVTLWGRRIDLAQSKCCQEYWMILLRQGVLWSKLMRGRRMCVCVLAGFAKGLWVQPPGAICPVVLGHMWPSQTYGLDYCYHYHCEHVCMSVCACMFPWKKLVSCMCSNILNWISQPHTFNLLHPNHQHF